MRILKIFLFVSFFPVLISSTTHKFYVSITKVAYRPEQQSLQVITTIFLDDLEKVLRERYNEPTLYLTPENEKKVAIDYIKKYVMQKLLIKVDGKEVNFDYIGKEYDIDAVKIYLEATQIQDFTNIEIENTVLFELTKEQQNIVHVKHRDSRKSLVLDTDNPNGLLNF